MFTIFRASVYATIFIGLVLVYLPARMLVWTGVVQPETIGLQQIAGMIIGAVGGLLAFWCVLTFVTMGQGTPAPFDAPRRLVVRGPYRFVRNPMYIGAVLALAGAAIFYGSLPIVIYTLFLVLAAHLFIVLYEEPALRRTFGEAYESYCRRVRRWWPGL